MRGKVREAAAMIVGFIALWYAGAMLNFFPFMGNDLAIRAVGFTGLLVCIVLVLCTCRIVDEIRKAAKRDSGGYSKMTIEQMRQPEALEIASRWKYEGEYAFYDMTADPEDYEEIVTPEKRGDRYFSVFDSNGLIGFFCVEQEGADIEIGLGLRPDLTGRGKGGSFLAEILCFVRENYSYEKIRIEVASFNRRAIQVYERAGFVKTGTAKVPTNGGIYDFTLMELNR